MLKFSKDEWRWLLIWSFITLGLSSLPFIWGWIITPSGQEFTGVLFNGYDSNSYLVKMSEGRRGDWVFRLAYTSENGGNGAVTFVFYLLLGKVAGFLSLSNILIFHVARILSGFLLLVASFGFIKLVFDEPKRQRWAFLLVCWSSGLGWLLVLLGLLAPPAPDFWVAEGYTFLSIFANPHFPLATGLLILAIMYGLAGLEGKGNRNYLVSAVLAFILGFIHPFLIGTLGAVLGLLWLRLALKNKPDWRGFIGLIVIGILGIPGPFLTWWGTTTDPLLQAWMRQNQTPTLSPLIMVVSYGLLVPLGLAGFWWVERLLPKTTATDPKNLLILHRWWLVTGWVIATIILMAIPVSFARRFQEGLHLPLCCLAAAGWYDVIALRLQAGFRKPLRQLLTFIMAIPSLGIVLISVLLLYGPHDTLDEPVYAPYFSAGERGAIDWLNQNAQVQDVVLSGPLLGNELPGRTPVRAYYGHGMETLEPETKSRLLNQFFANETSMAARTNLISSGNLKYLVYGWREQKIGSFDPANGGWPLVFNQDGVKIYLLKPSK